jgi:pimeloyl-ACP methyl ester carboxylesterase
VRGARFALVEDAGHFPHVEQPSATLDAIASFAPKA